MAVSDSRTSFSPPPWILTTAGLAVFGWLLFELKELVTLLVVGYCISYVMQPALDWLAARRIRRSVGVILLAGIGLIVGLVLVLTVIPIVIREVSALIENLPGYLAVARASMTEWLDTLRASLPKPLAEALPADVNGLLPLLDHVPFQKMGATVMSALVGGYTLTLAVVNVALLPFIVYEMAIHFGGMHRGAMKLIPRSSRERIRHVVQVIDRTISAYVRGQFVVCICLFLLYALGLGVVGIELWFLIAVVAGFGNLIPYVGTLIGIALGTLMALVTFGSFFAVLKVWAVFAVVQLLEGTIITPKIVGESVGLSPLMVMVSIFAGGALFGLLGVVLAVPIAAALVVSVGSMLDTKEEQNAGEPSRTPNH